MALFTREYGRTASYYNDNQFLPNFIREPVDFLPVNRSFDVARAIEICQDSYQCRYDYGMTLNRDMAEFTKNYLSSIVSIITKSDVLQLQLIGKATELCQEVMSPLCE